MEALKNRNKQEMENKNENQLIIYKSKKKENFIRYNTKQPHIYCRNFTFSI